MEQLPGFIEKKRSIANNYRTAPASVFGITSMPEAPWARSIVWLYTVLVDQDAHGKDSRALMRRLARQRIQSRPLWQPLHRSPVYRQAQVYGGEVADKLNRLALSLPCSVGLNEIEIQAVTGAIKSIHG